MRKRYFAVLPLAAALVLGPILAQPAVAAGHPTVAPAAAAAYGKPAAKPVVRPTVTPTVKPQPKKPAPPRPNGKPIVVPTAKPAGAPGAARTASVSAIASFTVPGLLTAVNATAGTITVLVSGGRGSVTMTVAATARVRIDNAAGTLAALRVGAHVSAQGTTTRGVRTVTNINAESRRAPASAPTATAAPAPVRGPSATPTNPAPSTQP